MTGTKCQWCGGSLTGNVSLGNKAGADYNGSALIFGAAAVVVGLSADMALLFRIFSVGIGVAVIVIELGSYLGRRSDKKGKGAT